MNTEAQLFSLFTLSPKITLFPVVHGSGDFTIELRRIMLNQKFDALAVPLPQSFQQPVEQALQNLPIAQIVYQQESYQSFSSGSEAELPTATYVPIEPCQPVITALRFALQEHLPRYFIDPEVESFEVHSAVLPDPYAVKQLASPRFAAATLPLLSSSFSPQLQYRAAGMVDRLRQMEKQHASILALCSYAEWMAIRAAYQQSLSLSQFGEETPPEADVRTALVTERSLIFMMGELPHLCAQYEIARRELEQDDNLSIDGMKQLLLETRDHYRSQQRSHSRPVTPKLLKIYLNYVRNLSLIERRLTPDLYTLVTAAQQIFSDQFAVHLAETARQYPFIGRTDEPRVTMGIDQMRTPDGQVYHTKSRLPGHPISWRT
ncbi:MAG: hypothetical protein KDA78_17830, partial [Planctomycetaceae bacterium]|nr:hypothetical protein [Planctomycetaceae bacterium]